MGSSNFLLNQRQDLRNWHTLTAYWYPDSCRTYAKKPQTLIPPCRASCFSLGASLSLWEKGRRCANKSGNPPNALASLRPLWFDFPLPVRKSCHEVRWPLYGRCGERHCLSFQRVLINLALVINNICNLLTSVEINLNLLNLLLHPFS